MWGQCIFIVKTSCASTVFVLNTTEECSWRVAPHLGTSRQVPRRCPAHIGTSQEVPRTARCLGYA